MNDDFIPSLKQLRGPLRRRASNLSLFAAFEAAEEAKDDADTPSPSAVSHTVQARDVPKAPAVVEDAAKVWSVAELLGRVRGWVERSYGAVTIEGEISNWRPAASGHCYFTLKDGAAQLAIVMFRQAAQRTRFRPKDGDTVRVTGALSVYESRGQMQLVAERMEQVGLGALLAATRELKERLRAEGLFDRKRPLPAFPRCIGVVTSLQGAALRDIVQVCRRRHAGVRLLVHPATVQGPSCAVDVVRALRWFGEHRDCVDVVLVARGGGSWEDLHGFDDERVVRAIVACPLPVIAGIGHATDTTLADSAADLCAPTPSAAAELLTAAHHRLEEQVDGLTERLERAALFEVLRAQRRLAHLGAEAQLRRAADRVRRSAQRVDELIAQLAASSRHLLRSRRDALTTLEQRLLHRSPQLQIHMQRTRLDNAGQALKRAKDRSMQGREWKLQGLESQLAALSPLSILGRGYALLQDTSGRVIREAGQVHSGQTILARLERGRIRARVEYSEER